MNARLLPARLQRTLASAERLLLCLDYDGTLVPIAPHPSQATLPARTARLLERLSRQPGISVVLISGRALRDLKRLVGLPGLCYVGNHGLELRGDGCRYVNPIARASRSRLNAMARRAQAALASIPGAWVEDKGLTVSLHWRAVPRSAQRAFHAAVARLAAPRVSDGAVRLTRGKRVMDIRPPVAWGKGDALTWLHRRLTADDPSRALLVYLGDDQTDEDAFRVVNRLGGISVFVGPSRRATAARWRLRDPREVREALARMLQERVRWTSGRAQ